MFRKGTLFLLPLLCKLVYSGDTVPYFDHCYSDWVHHAEEHSKMVRCP